MPPQLRDRAEVDTSRARPGGSSSKRKDVKSFNELLMLFPMIARQMQPGLEKLFQEFEVSFQKFKPLPAPPPSPRSVASGMSSSRNSTHSSVSGDLYKQAADESEIRRSLESAIVTAVDLFQRVDQSQLNLLASSTDLTGLAVDRLIERYVAEQLHDSILFPRICATKSIEDEELEHKIMDMANVDLTQVGIPSLDQQAKKSLIQRLGRGIKSFAKIGAAKSPHAMTEYLLETAQTLTRLDDDPPEEPGSSTSSTKNPEKSTVVTMNADMLVSLLLIVVIRAKVPNLHACLSYMKDFVFAEDVEQGETGYVLSTLEAVLFHIAQDHALSAASRSNERLWKSVRGGDLEAVRRLLEPTGGDGRSRASSRVRSDDEAEGSGSGSDEVDGGGEAAGEASGDVPTVQVYSPVREQANGFMEELQKVSETNGDTESEASASSDEVVNEPSSQPTAETNDVTKGDDITNHEIMEEDADENSKTPGDNELSLNGTTPNDEIELSTDEPSNGKVKEEVKDTPATNGITPMVAVEALEEEAYTDPFETASAESSASSLAGSISTLRIEDLTTDGQDDAASLLSIAIPPPPPPKSARHSPNGRAGVARFEVDEPRAASIKFSQRHRCRSATSLATTIGDTDSMMRLSRTYTSQSQTADSFSAEKLSKTRNAMGESVLMMAIQERRMEVLTYLLETQMFDLEFLVEDSNNEGTTLLSAAVQAQSQEIVDIICPRFFEMDDVALRKYFTRPDTAGRTVAHYLFSTPDLIRRLGRWLPWKTKDKNGQTPLFALCRSYDHPRYKEMVGSAIKQAQHSQGDGCKLHLDEHVDNKGNTLLHIVGDPAVLRTLLRCDSEVNAVNDRGFTALMVASKYGRVEMVRTFFADPRVDLMAKELRGLTAVELAKDDDVRNRIDGELKGHFRTLKRELRLIELDLVLFQNPHADDGRVTAVVRSFFVEDATIRVVVKSGAPAGESTFTITTCRRSLTDFQFLAQWLAYENPGSWLPTLPVLRSPYQIPSKPSRAVLRDIQLRVDCFLRTLLTHSTFSTHELLWEFFLVPDLQQELMIERSKKKAETRMEKIREDFTPVEDIRDVEIFVSHAKDSVRSINYACRSVTRRATALRYSLFGMVPHLVLL